jgi:hypothetical protein
VSGDTAYDVFNATYGLDIKKDKMSTARPQSGSWDMGAYEYGPCHTLDATQTPLAGFGAAYNTRSVQQELLLKAICNPGSIAVTIGNGNRGRADGDGLLWIWGHGYQLVNNTWQSVTLTCSQGRRDVPGGYWCKGTAQGSIDPLSPWFLGYTCQYDTATKSYKCGCQDQACTQNYWQLQGVMP